MILNEISSHNKKKKKKRKEKEKKRKTQRNKGMTTRDRTKEFLDKRGSFHHAPRSRTPNNHPGFEIIDSNASVSIEMEDLGPRYLRDGKQIDELLKKIKEKCQTSLPDFAPLVTFLPQHQTPFSCLQCRNWTRFRSSMHFQKSWIVMRMLSTFWAMRSLVYSWFPPLPFPFSLPEFFDWAEFLLAAFGTSARKN